MNFMIVNMDVVVANSLLSDIISYIENRYISRNRKKEINLIKRGILVDFSADKRIKEIDKKLKNCC